MAKFDIANEIQHQIDDQIRMREGAMKLMSACSTLNQALETSKNLLTINARILGLMSALQRKKKQHVLKEYNRQRNSVCLDSSEDCCPGRIAMSELRVPLMWKDNVHFSGKTGDQSYYAFALIRCGDQVRDTSLYEITSADTDMYFAETLIFEEMLPDVKMDFEIYYTVITSSEANPILKTPRASITIRSSSRRQAHFSAPKFCLAGHVQLCIDDIRAGMISKDLTMGGKGASGVAVLGDIQEFPIHPLELWGQICCELAAQPRCMLDKSVCGYCQIKVEESWCKCYAEVYRCNIRGWKDKDQAVKTDPDHSIKLEEDMKVCVDDTGGGSCILNLSSKNEILYTLQFLNDTDFMNWKFALRKEIHNLRSWKAACKELMHIEEHKKCRLSIPSTASFYDQIDIGDQPIGYSPKSTYNGSVKGTVNSLSDIKETPELSEMNKHENVFNSISTTNSTSSEPPDYDTIMSLPHTPSKMVNDEIKPKYLGSQGKANLPTIVDSEVNDTCGAQNKVESYPVFQEVKESKDECESPNVKNSEQLRTYESIVIKNDDSLDDSSRHDLPTTNINTDVAHKETETDSNSPPAESADLSQNNNTSRENSVTECIPVETTCKSETNEEVSDSVSNITEFDNDSSLECNNVTVADDSFQSPLPVRLEGDENVTTDANEHTQRDLEQVNEIEDGTKMDIDTTNEVKQDAKDDLEKPSELLENGLKNDSEIENTAQKDCKLDTEVRGEEVAGDVSLLSDPEKKTGVDIELDSNETNAIQKDDKDIEADSGSQQVCESEKTVPESELPNELKQDTELEPHTGPESGENNVDGNGSLNTTPLNDVKVEQNGGVEENGGHVITECDVKQSVDTVSHEADASSDLVPCSDTHVDVRVADETTSNDAAGVNNINGVHTDESTSSIPADACTDSPKQSNTGENECAKEIELQKGSEETGAAEINCTKVQDLTGNEQGTDMATGVDLTTNLDNVVAAPGVKSNGRDDINGEQTPHCENNLGPGKGDVVNDVIINTSQTDIVGKIEINSPEQERTIETESVCNSISVS